MKGFIEEFKNFAIKGNMIDMAIGIIIGTAFNNVVNTMVKKVVMPPLSLMTDGVNLSDKNLILRQATDSAEQVVIGYGALVEALIDFGIIALTIFILVKGMNRLRHRADNPEDVEVVTQKNFELLSNLEILMQEQNELFRNLKK